MTMAALSIDYLNKSTNHHIYLPLSVFMRPKTLEQYQQLQTVLDQLIDEVRDDEHHPLALAMQIIGENLEQYDDEHYPSIGAAVTDIDMVKHLMKSHHLHQKDLADIFGSQANVSKFLSGKRQLGKNVILGLKKKFGISADFFI